MISFQKIYFSYIKEESALKHVSFIIEKFKLLQANRTFLLLKKLSSGTRA